MEIYDKTIWLSLSGKHKLCQQDLENIKFNNSKGWRNQCAKTFSIEHSSLEKLRGGFRKNSKADQITGEEY